MQKENEETQKTTILLTKKTQNLLKQYGNMSESYEDVIIKLIKEYDKKKR